MINRPRRLRKTAIIREAVSETKLSKEMFVFPYFVTNGKKIKREIPSMPGIFHFSADTIIKDIEKGLKSGVNKILLFGTGEKKSENASSSHSHNAVIPRAIKEIKKAFGDDLYIITDVCLCAYTTHGHCGVIDHNYVQNDKSVEIIAKMALTHAQAGADMVAPSDMMDGRIAAIRNQLDKNAFENTAIMSYAIKYASSYYGPFRDAADSAPEFGDRKSYQMDFRNPGESMKEAKLDGEEGADILMVKPALAYLDIISKLKQQTNLPVACYNVSGEYSMVKAAAKNGWADEQKTVMENMYAFARAGANIIISYHTREIFEQHWL